MSGQQPRPGSGRRRIAGERRDRRPEETVSDGSPAPVQEPVTDPVEAPEPARVSTGASAAAVAAATPDERSWRAPSWRTVSILGGVAALLAVVALLVTLVWPWPYSDVRENDRVAEATRTAPAAAERAAAPILSYNHASLDEDKKAALALMTPKQRKEYADTFERFVRPNATKLRAKVTAQVRASGVSQAGADRVNVVLYVNQTTVSANNRGEPQVALNRVLMKMSRPDGTWLVDDITSY